MAPSEGEWVDVWIQLPRTIVEALILSARPDDRDVASERRDLARAVLRARQRRPRIFPGVSLGEPSWDMILELYVAEHAGHRLDVTSLCATTGVSRTTALRHLDGLAASGLVHRVPDQDDRRRMFVDAGESLRTQVERWLDAEIVARRIATAG